MKHLKRHMLAVAVLGTFGGAVHAQTEGSTVQIYGLIDTSLRHVNNVNAKGDSLVGFQTPWFSGSRLGFTGTEKVGGGLSVDFKLESEFVTRTGEMDTPGVFFNRDAWVALHSDSAGLLRIGRQNTVARDFAQIYGDTYGSEKLGYSEGGFTNTNNFKQVIYYAGSVTGTRSDNGIQWKKVFDNGFVAAAGHALGEVPGDASRNTTNAVALGYNGPNYTVAGFYTRANVAGLKHDSYSVGGAYSFPLVRLNAGYFRYNAEQGAIGQRKDDVWTVGAKFTPGGAFDYELGYVNFNVKNGAYNGAATGILNPYADASGATAAGTGKKGTVYASAFYHLSKRTELYVAADYMKLNDGFRVASAAGQTSQTELAVGMRTRF